MRTCRADLPDKVVLLGSAPFSSRVLSAPVRFALQATVYMRGELFVQVFGSAPASFYHAAASSTLLPMKDGYVQDKLSYIANG